MAPLLLIPFGTLPRGPAPFVGAHYFPVQFVCVCVHPPRFCPQQNALGRIKHIVCTPNPTDGIQFMRSIRRRRRQFFSFFAFSVLGLLLWQVGAGAERAKRRAKTTGDTRDTCTHTHKQKNRRLQIFSLSNRKILVREFGEE